MAYDNIYSVGYRRWDSDDNDDLHAEPEVDVRDASLDEMYFDTYDGNLHITVETPDGYIGLDIPVLPVKSWGKFVDSLPTWSTE